MYKLTLITLGFIILLNSNLLSQEMINVFFKCPSIDMDYLKEEISYINYLNEQHHADIIVYESIEVTGSKGEKYSLFFKGQNKFQNINDTIYFFNNPTLTSDEKRKNAVKNINFGLVKYILLGNIRDSLNISISRIETKSKKSEIKDKWRNWSQSISSSFYLNQDQNYSSSYFNFYVNSQKVTEKIKINTTARATYNKNIYNYNDIEYIGINSSKSIDNTTVFSINNHWSHGITFFASSSTFSNKEFNVSTGPAIEYNIFPYSESNRQQLRLLYSITPSYNKYIDTTIFNKKEEYLYSNFLSITNRTVKQWGNIDFGISWSNYLHDFKFNSQYLWANVNIRLFKNLSLSIYGSGGITKNQLNIAKGNLSDEEVLLQLKAQQSNYVISSSIGLTYRFGSIYNNVVNPRFGD